MSTIKKVAKEAGVSTATVSRVLNGNYPVSKEAYERVMAAVKATGYKGNAIAKSLKMNKTFMIGLVVPDLSNIYFMEIAKGIEEKLSQYGYTLTICSTDEDTEKEMKVLNALNNRKVDAIVLATCQQDGKHIQSIMEDGTPVVLIDSKIQGVTTDFVGEDNFGNSKRLVDYLIEKGHTNIGIIKGKMTMGTAKERYEGFIAAMKQHDLEIKHELEGDYSFQSAYDLVVGHYKHKSHLPTAIYTTNNKMAEGTLQALHTLGYQVPEDVSMISYGNISLPGLIEPQLTVIDQRPKMIGLKTGDLLIRKLEEKVKRLEHEIVALEIKIGTSIKDF